MRASLTALRRAAALARKVAIDTNTGLVVVRDGQLVQISADILRSQMRAEKDSEG